MSLIRYWLIIQNACVFGHDGHMQIKKKSYFLVVLKEYKVIIPEIYIWTLNTQC